MNRPGSRAEVYASLARMAAEMGALWARSAPCAPDPEHAEDRRRTAALYFAAALELPALERASREKPKLVK